MEFVFVFILGVEVLDGVFAPSLSEALDAAGLDLAEGEKDKVLEP